MNKTYIIVGVVWMLFNVVLLVGGVSFYGSINFFRALQFAFLFAGAGILIYIGYTKPEKKKR